MILVTGASGTLGKAIARQLKEAGMPFRCLVRPTSQRAELEALGASLSLGDVTDRGFLSESMDGVESIISTHSLGIQKKGSTYWDVDYQGNCNLIELLKANGGRKFVFISALGASLNSPFSLYRVKQLVENALTVSGLDYTVLKPSGFFSDFTRAARLVQRYHILPAIGSGNHQVQGIAVDDVARCAIDALTNDRASHQVISLGGPEILTLKKVAHLYAVLLGHPVRILPIPIPLLRILGWTVDTLTSYRHEIQGLVSTFAQDSLCDNKPFLDIFPHTLKTFEAYLNEYLAQTGNKDQ